MCTCKRKSKFTCMYMYIQNHSFKLTMASFIHKIVLQNKAWIERHTVQPYSRLLLKSQHVSQFPTFTIKTLQVDDPSHLRNWLKINTIYAKLDNRMYDRDSLHKGIYCTLPLLIRALPCKMSDKFVLQSNYL